MTTWLISHGYASEAIYVLLALLIWVSCVAIQAKVRLYRDGKGYDARVKEVLDALSGVQKDLDHAIGDSQERAAEIIEQQELFNLRTVADNLNLALEEYREASFESTSPETMREIVELLNQLVLGRHLLAEDADDILDMQADLTVANGRVVPKHDEAERQRFLDSRAKAHRR